MAQTKLADIINPEVMADMIDKKLVDLMKFAPLATIDNTLEGQPGNQIKLPSYAYVGDASTLAEGIGLTPAQLTASATPVTIHKIAQGVELTDEAVLSGLVILLVKQQSRLHFQSHQKKITKCSQLLKVLVQQ